MPTNDSVANPGLTVAVLSLLGEHPRHPYEMRMLLRARGVVDLVRFRGGSLYDAIRRLEREGLIEPAQRERVGARPERTVYAITDAGTATLTSLLAGMLGEPVNEYPRFPAALAHILHLSAGEAVGLLRRRAACLDETLARAQARPPLPRVAILQSEYQRAMWRAERDWVVRTADEIESGDMSWSVPPSEAPEGVQT